MRFGLFGMNVVGGLVMTQTPKWYPSFSLIASKLNYIESVIPKKSEFAFVPISRWKGYSGERDIAGDSIESISLSSYLLSKTSSTKIFGTFQTFAYEPELLGHVSARLNYEFNNRFALNIVGGWKKDEYEYFKKTFLEDSNAIYSFASKWVVRFRESEFQHSETIKSLMNSKKEFYKAEVISAAFSPPGRDFAMKHADALFTTVTKNQLNKKNNLKLASAISVFVRSDITQAENYYSDLLGKNADLNSAKNFCKELADSNPIKSFLHTKNIHLVKSGAGIEELVTDKVGLKLFILNAKEKGIKTLLFALPDFDESLDILLEVLLEADLFN